jgi:hypothetical protein
MIPGTSKEEIVFYKSIPTGNWWMEVPGTSGTEKVPCSEEDYFHCLSGEIPSRWLNHSINIS